MKIVENREEFESQLESAKREGRKSFGDDTVLLEKYVTKPRRKSSFVSQSLELESTRRQARLI